MLIQLNFHNVTDLLAARKLIMPLIQKNKEKKEIKDSYEEIALSNINNDLEDSSSNQRIIQDPSELIYDIREYDVPYHVRVAIDKDIRVGKWYTVESKAGMIELTEMPEREIRADPVVLAFDIETTKLPLKFPDATIDKVMMISYMIDGEGFLITNREIVSQDIDDFEYTPKPEYKGVFTIFNEPDEKSLLLRFFEHIQDAKPSVIATFNGDFFDWPFVEKRAAVNGIDMYEEIGFKIDSEAEYKSAHCCHMDCFRWVKRDSYLPQGSQGLKAVTTAKLGYNPIEIDPELMTPYAIEKPQTMAEYSVSDAVATYYLYMKYVHPFIFSLCNIIPLNPDEVLRKGTGTLCEMLLMVQAYKGSIVLPNKHTDPVERFYKGHLLETETYVGGHVESLEAGVFRSDIPSKFEVDPTAVDEVLNDLDNALIFSIEVEAQKKLEDVTNYDEVKEAIAKELLELKNNPNRTEKPSIYHVDVASMYPNIMTTNRLQPDSMITEEDCASCDFNRPGKTCDRRLPWAWRGEYFPAKMDEYLMIRRALENEVFPGKRPNAPPIPFQELSPTEKAAQIKKRLTEYSRKVYHKIHQTETIEREAIICQRENPFYVNTVRDFRDRRYHFKTLQKVWKKKASEIDSSNAAAKEDAKKMIVLYDSLQLAHKVILNSFYGYVMRKGSRWYSMEMAGVTCLTGATIIQMARSLVERLGRPLELDTDGIWCILPGSFPENFTFNLKDGKKIFVSYPCVMLNHLVHARFTNHQYQTLVDPKTFKYSTMSDNSIFFEVDGPYKAMVLPTSKEEGKGLKKRYAVFNDDGSLAELKGFELKRRGELKLIKTFQSQIFKEFLNGTTLEECYGAVARVANSWLDILESKGTTLDREELLDLISENRSMSKSLEEYGDQKSTSITTAKRLAEFLGASMVKDRGLNCKYIISDRPYGAPVAERAIPVAIFSAEKSVKSHYMRKWLKDPSLDEFDPRAILDWQYYWERLASTIQKIITIPAALQDVENPVPRIPHPDWLERKVNAKHDKFKQKKLSNFFQKASPKDDSAKIVDIEDIGKSKDQLTAASIMPKVGKVSKVSKRTVASVDVEAPEEEFMTLPSEAPSIDGPYSEWLKYQKQVWKLQKQERARHKQVFGQATAHRSTGIASMIQNQVEQAYSSENWSIVQVASSERPGEIKVTVSITGKLQTVKVKVPRKFYVNFKTGRRVPSFEEIQKQLPNCKIERAPTMVLPDGSTSTTLIRVTTSETIFIEKMNRVDSILRHPLVEGIYETSIDSVQNAVLELGICCRLDDSQPGLLGKGLTSGFNLDWLIPVREDKNQRRSLPYLDSISFQYIHVVHISFSDYQVVNIISTHSNKAFTLVLRPTSQSQSLPNLSRMYSSMLEEKLSKHGGKDPRQGHFITLPDQLEFEDFTFNNTYRFFGKVNKILETLQAERAIQTIAVLQSPTPERIKTMVRAINDFPICQLREVDTNTLPAIAWQSLAGKKLLSQFFGLDKWLLHLHELSKYSQIPICNLTYDDMRYVMDVSYARKLRSNGLVLWWSPKFMPDEGGKELDFTALAESEVAELPTVNNPGLHTSVCIDLDVRNLMINTVLTSSLIMNAEGTNSAINTTIVESNTRDGTVEEMVIPFVEDAFSTPAITALSSIVKTWWNEALREDEGFAATYSDSILSSFLSWVSSRGSFMYHKQLYQHVKTLCKKVFIQLLREFRKVGSRIVFANQSRVVILTSKTSVETAYSYANYLVKSIKSKSFFHFLDINISQYWGRLIWMDEVNYGGLRCKDIGADEESTKLQLVMNWDLCEFLPTKLSREFTKWVSAFIYAVDERLKAAMMDVDGEDGQESRPTQLPNSEQDDGEILKGVAKSLEKQLLARIKSLIQQQYMAQSVNLEEAEEQGNLEAIQLVDDFAVVDHPGSIADALESATAISKKNHSNNNIATSFGKAGSVSVSINNNMVLQLAKFLCAVFALAKPIELEVRLVRRHILALFEIREFSMDGNFTYPVSSLKIPNYTCTYCCEVQDVDICRGVSRRLKQQRLRYSKNGGDNANSKLVFSLGTCQECGKELNRVELEELLIKQIYKMLTQYQVQDLKCVKCKRIREDDMSEHCSCSGEWAETVPRSEILKRMSIFSHAAHFYGLKLLQELVDEIL